MECDWLWFLGQSLCAPIVAVKKCYFVLVPSRNFGSGRERLPSSAKGVSKYTVSSPLALGPVPSGPAYSFIPPQ